MADNRTSRGLWGEPAADPTGGYYDLLARALLDEYLGYGGFVYDPESDPYYVAYRDKYTREGGAAMRDAYAAASTMTGGYGNSYAAAAGSAAYGEYLDKLNDRLSDLYGAAYKRYTDGADAAYKRYKTVSDFFGGLADRYYADRKFRYGVESDLDEKEYDRNYRKERDAVKDRQWEMRYLSGLR